MQQKAVTNYPIQENHLVLFF